MKSVFLIFSVFFGMLVHADLSLFSQDGPPSQAELESDISAEFHASKVTITDFQRTSQSLNPFSAMDTYSYRTIKFTLEKEGEKHTFSCDFTNYGDKKNALITGCQSPEGITLQSLHPDNESGCCDFIRSDYLDRDYKFSDSKNKDIVYKAIQARTQYDYLQCKGSIPIVDLGTDQGNVLKLKLLGKDDFKLIKYDEPNAKVTELCDVKDGNIRSTSGSSYPDSDGFLKNTVMPNTQRKILAGFADFIKLKDWGLLYQIASKCCSGDQKFCPSNYHLPADPAKSKTSR